jgi:hypothetical protein
MDEGGWNSVKPFLAETHVPYPMLLGDDPMAQQYGIQNLPDTFPIDRQGRVAAAYLSGPVDKDDVEANIKAPLSQRSRLSAAPVTWPKNAQTGNLTAAPRAPDSWR